MTKSEFSGPGLNTEQWESLKALATSLSPDQSNWVGGYFTGYADAARQGQRAPVEAPPAVATAQRTLTILYGSETGNGGSIAGELVQQAQALGIPATAADMASYRPAALKQEQDLLIVTSTHGEGEPPQPAQGFFEFLDGRRAPRLEGTRFAVMALGDSTYEFYCEAGKRLDRRLEALGAERLAPRIDCDVDQIGQGKSWAAGVLQSLAAAPGPASVPASAATAGAAPTSIDQANPFTAEVLENLVITGRGSSKQTRHLELSLAGSGIVYEPGDALGIIGQNDPRVVAELLDALALDPAQAVTVDDRETRLGDALQTGFEIATATPRFLTHWAELSGSAELAELTASGTAADRTAWLEAHHIVDIVRNYPIAGLGANELLAGMRRLQPRLYSISSSHAAQDGDVHLTVSSVRYTLHGTERHGVVSGALGRLDDAATVPVYLKSNPHFRLPADDAPIIMVGAGTGVAPYRAFMQERELRGAKGLSWLVFGDRNFRSDFLYQTEWQEQLKAGTLTNLDVAFSRDAAPKAYVQHRLRERGSELYAWLEQGAHLYVCGDAKGMAPDVHQALLDVVTEHGGHAAEAAEDYLRTLQRDGRYQRDVY